MHVDDSRSEPSAIGLHYDICIVRKVLSNLDNHAVVQENVCFAQDFVAIVVSGPNGRIANQGARSSLPSHDRQPHRAVQHKGKPTLTHLSLRMR